MAANISLSLEGKKCLVVGASAGIGKATAIDLVRLGGDVVFVGRSQEKLDAAIAVAGGRALSADISDPDKAVAMVDEAAKMLGGLDVVLICVGVSRLGLVENAAPDLWKEVFETNVIGPAMVVKGAVKHLSAGGYLGMMSSESVGMAYPGLTPYASSKAALEEIVRGVRAEHPELRVSCVRVGATGDTEFARDFDPELAMELTQVWVKRGNIPAKNMTSEGLGGTIARFIATVMQFTDIDPYTIDLRGTGGPFYGDMEEFMAHMTLQMGG
jgi:NAD(P)-dependent dehydrogenase (short-subunit alcohol dehydrogenase family)